MKKYIYIIIAILLFSNYNSQARTCEWAQKVGGPLEDFTKSIVVDETGNLYVSGFFDSDTIKFNNGFYLTNSNTSSDDFNKYKEAYIAKYNTNGECIWVEKIKGVFRDWYWDYIKIALDRKGNIYIGGNFIGPKLEFNNGISATKEYIYDVDIFIAKYNNNGVCQWAQAILGSGDNSAINNYCESIAVDANGNVYIAGHFNSDTLNFNNGAYISKSEPFSSAYFVKFNSDGDCLWAQKITSDGYTNAQCIFIDAFGNIYLGGSFMYSNLISFNNGIALISSDTITSGNAYIAKYNSKGLCLWAQEIGGREAADYGESITVDVYGNVYVAGYSYSKIINFNNGISLIYNNGSGSFVAKYNLSGLCIWAQKNSRFYASESNLVVDNEENAYYGGVKWNKEYCDTIDDKDVGAIALDLSNNIYTTGYFRSKEINFINGITLSNSGIQYGSADGYIAKFKQGPAKKIPVLITKSASSITQISAISGGVISDAGDTLVISRGICWNTSGEPTVIDDKSSDGSGIGSFVSSLNNLTPNTNYFIRAYAIGYGIAYGNEVSFTTLKALTYTQN